MGLGEEFYSPIIKSQPFNKLIPLGCEHYNSFSVFSFPLVWDRMGSVGWNWVRAYLRDIASLVPECCNKANITLKQVTQIFCFLGRIKLMFALYCGLKCAIVLCL